jgi:hypothetical protein
MTHLVRLSVLAAATLLVLPASAAAGPPLICHPFHTEGSALLQWGSGPGWNTPDRRYDVQRLVADTVALLDSDAPILTRMENMRRAAIYATRDRRLAEQLLATVVARAAASGATRVAVFDAGYLIETYKQATHLFGRPVTSADGYAMVLRALDMGAPAPEIEFAAALMTQGPTSSMHLQRARAAANGESLLARNITSLGW